VLTTNVVKLRCRTVPAWSSSAKLRIVNPGCSGIVILKGSISRESQGWNGMFWLVCENQCHRPRESHPVSMALSRNCEPGGRSVMKEAHNGTEAASPGLTSRQSSLPVEI